MKKIDESGLNKKGRILLLVGILFISINLRPALSSIGPLIDMVWHDIGLSDTLLGLLTILPLARLIGRLGDFSINHLDS